MSKSRKRLRTELLQSWLTPEEAAVVRRKAAEVGVSVSETIRMALFRYRPPPTKADQQALGQVLAELGKIGGNVNQYAKSRNMGRQSDNLDLAMEAALRELVEWRTALMQAMGAERNRKPKDG